MAKIYTGDNPSELYVNSLLDLIRDGDTVAPRGKAVKEIRPVIYEFTNPLNRVTFVRGRKINPFFQMAEALWILAGRSDVEWLTNFNKNMAEFSDDGRYFNAPYGQRLRSWNVNDVTGFIFNPFDQLSDVYEKFQKDIHTRQAVASIYNPIFDNSHYQGKDTPCNLILTFKVRNGKLDLTVFNRSNDIHWGVFGANIVQFSTIQEVMASWLGVPVGKYCQITDSLHVYLDDYGAKETEKIFNAYHIDPEYLTLKHWLIAPTQFRFLDEPRITFGKEDFDLFLSEYFNSLDIIIQGSKMEDVDVAGMALSFCDRIPDLYFRNTVIAMVVYRAHRLGMKGIVFEGMKKMIDSQWKLSCLHFLYNKYKDDKEFTDIYATYPEDMVAYIRGE